MTAKTFFSILSIFLFTLSAAGGQVPDAKRDRTWVIGRIGLGIRNVLDFQTSPPALTEVGSSLSMESMGASVCDTAGQLLLYTNGFRIMNRDHLLMENGDSLNCCLGYFQNGMNTGFGAFQGALILPAPGNGRLYYVFTANLDMTGSAPYFQHTSAIYYSVVDMAQAGGLGRVVQKNVPLIQDTLNIGMLNACRHANGRDWWVLVREYASNRYHSFLLTPSGIQERGVQAVGTQVGQHTYGQTVFSPDGSRFAFAQVNHPNHQILHYNLYDFDRCTGLLSNHVFDTLPSNGSYCGAVFSPDSRYFYVSSVDTLYRFNMQDTSWQTSRQIVAHVLPWSDPTGYAFGYMTGGPDGKIYVYGGNGVFYLNVINTPDSADCGFTHHSFPITTYNGLCMPYFPHFRLGALAGSGCDTLASVQDAVAVGGLRLYPNPSRGVLHFELPLQMQVGSLELYDQLGRLMQRLSVPAGTGRLEVDCRGFPSGIYVAKWSAGVRGDVCKFVIAP